MDFFLLTFFGLFENGDIKESLNNTVEKLPGIVVKGFGYLPFMKYILHRYIPFDF